MEENTAYRKKSIIFIAAAAIFYYALDILANLINSQFALGSMEDYYNTQWIYSAVSLCVTALTVVAFFVLGKKLTSSNRKALIFMGSVYFARTASGIASSFFGSICQILMRTGTLDSMTYANIVLVIEFVFLPLIVFIAYFAFSALEGMNPRFPSQSLDTLKTSASRARIGYFVVCIAVSLVAAINSLPNLIFAFLGSDFIASNTVTVISFSVEWLVNLLTFVLFYFVCYKVTKSHVEAMCLAAIIKVSDAIPTVFGGLINTAANVAVRVFNLGSEENIYIYSAVTNISTWTRIALVTILSVVLAMYFIGRFFPKVNKCNEYGEKILTEDNSAEEVPAE